MSGHIFISYARQDGREYAERLDNDLANAGFRTWRDTRSINEYQDFSAEIENAIRDASYVAVCVTPSIDANPHSFVRREIIYADSKEKPIIPLVFPNADVPTLVNHLTWIAFGDGKRPGQKLDYEGGLSRLLARLKAAPQPTRQRESSDPYREYLKVLYDRIVYYLNQTVFSLITLSSEATPGAVEEVATQALPMAFFDMAGIGGKANEKARFQNFYEAFDKYGGRMLLLGEPGAGKTTTLMAFARDAVWKRLENPALPLPILAPIATWDGQKQTPLAEWLAEAIPMLKRDDVAHLITVGNALLMLDGLDELGGERETPPPDPLPVHGEGESNPLPASPKHGGGVRYDPRQRFLQMLTLTPNPSPSSLQEASHGRGEEMPLAASNQVVVTCRVKDYEEIGEKIALKGAVTLQALNDEQMREYLREMPDLWAALKADNDLREVARTPLLLSVFTYAFAGLDEEAKKLRDLSRGDLRDKIFETYIRRRYEHEERKLKVRGEQMPFTLEEIYEVLGKATMKVAKSPFWREHLGFGFDFISIFDSDFASIVETPVEGEILVQLLTLLHIIHPQELTPVYDEGKYVIGLPTVRFVHLLLRDYFAFRYAMVLLQAIDVFARVGAINTLGAVRDARAVLPLMAFLGDENPDVFNSAHAALGRLGDPALQPLISALRDEAPRVRAGAASALRGLGDERAVQPLLALLNDDDPLVEASARGALTHLGTREALEAVARWRREQGQGGE